jgi:hypothetical protein
MLCAMTFSNEKRLVASFIIWNHQSVFQLVHIIEVSISPLGNLFSYIAFIYVHKIQYRHSLVVYNIVTFFNNKFSNYDINY